MTLGALGLGCLLDCFGSKENALKSVHHVHTAIFRPVYRLCTIFSGRTWTHLECELSSRKDIEENDQALIKDFAMRDWNEEGFSVVVSSTAFVASMVFITCALNLPELEASTEYAVTSLVVSFSLSLLGALLNAANQRFLDSQESSWNTYSSSDRKELLDGFYDEYLDSSKNKDLPR